MKAYFDFYNIIYQHKSLYYENEYYEICDYNPQTESKGKYEKLINICNNTKLNLIGQKYFALSSNWYNTAKEQNDLNKVKKNLTNYFINIVEAKSNSIMWTSFKNSKHFITGRGFTYTKPKKELIENDKKSYCFVSCNTRATNDFSNRFNLAYMINIFMQPYIKKFFLLKNIKVNEDQYALNEMIQWIWRSRIRNDESINIYIPSSRMRNLLVNWMKNIT
jgi:hypothetical protein